MGVRVLASCAVSRSKQMPPSCHWQVPAAGPLLLFATDYFDALCVPRQPGRQLRSCPPGRAAPALPPLLRCVAHV